MQNYIHEPQIFLPKSYYHLKIIVLCSKPNNVLHNHHNKIPHRLITTTQWGSKEVLVVGEALAYQVSLVKSDIVSNYDMYIHPSNIYTINPTAYPSSYWVRGGFVQDKSPVHNRATQRQNTTHSHIHGRCTQAPHRKVPHPILGSNLEPSCCEVTTLTTVPQRHPSCSCVTIMFCRGVQC